MEIELFGAGKEVTGSCYSLTIGDEKILIDCGMFQGGKDSIKKNYDDFGFNPREYSNLLLTHAHLDHCGRIPKLVKYGFRGKIYCTDATKGLAFIIMMDAAKIAAQDTENENKRRVQQGLAPRKPIYNDVDVNNAMKLFKIISYDEQIKVTENVTVKFYDAGHILGAASLELNINDEGKNKIVVFSGDIGQGQGILVKDTESIKKADYVFIESTYGDRLHPPIEDREKELLRIINESYRRGGKLMIPSFAVERAQEILYSIGKFKTDKLIPDVKVYLDSPMAVRATEVFTKFKDYYNDAVKKSINEGKDPFSFPGLTETPTVDDSKKINDVTGPCIVLAGNGMCTAGRIKHHIKNGISNPKNTILFVGYQAMGSLGYWIEKGEKRIRLLGTEVDVNSKIENIDGFSAHADYKGLIKWLDNFSSKPKKVFITHGEEKQSVAFSERINKLKFKSYIPSEGEVIKI